MIERKKNFKIVGVFLSLFLTILLVSCSENCEFNSIKTEKLPDAVVGQEYSFTIEAETSCTPSFNSFEKTAGSLPTGITLVGTGELNGTPTQSGIDTFTVNVRVCFGTGVYGPTDCSDKTKVYTLKVK